MRFIETASDRVTPPGEIGATDRGVERNRDGWGPDRTAEECPR